MPVILHKEQKQKDCKFKVSLGEFVTLRIQGSGTLTQHARG